jgi:hypothetical protein
MNIRIELVNLILARDVLSPTGRSGPIGQRILLTVYHAKSYSSHVTLLYQRPSEVHPKYLPWTRLTGLDILDPFLQLLVRLDQGRCGTRSHLAVVHERCKSDLLSFTICLLKDSGKMLTISAPYFLVTIVPIM